MNCPLKLYVGAVSGTTQYYVAPCSCLDLCDFNKCKYMRQGFIAEVVALAGTGTNTATILTKCGGALPLYASSTGDAVTCAQLTAGLLLKIYPTWVSGAPKGIVEGL